MTLTTYISSRTVRISGARSISETTELLGHIFGVLFEPAEDAGPGLRTWIGKRGGLRYIFNVQRGTLGTGDAHQAPADYELSVQSINSAAGARELEIADYLVTRIRRDGRLNCWPDYQTRAMTK